MVPGVPAITRLAELRGFVQQTICDRQQLLLEAFPIHKRILVRRGKPCGLHFTLVGPRSVKFSAIWDASKGTVLFYDCNGDRFYRRDLALSETLQQELAGLA
jgi:hypothetical protein